MIGKVGKKMIRGDLESLFYQLLISKKPFRDPLHLLFPGEP